MGKRGAKPRPTHLKVLDGNPGKRPLNQNEPKPKPISPTPPSWLRPIAKTMWKHLAPQLESLGLLTIIDGYALECACESYATWVICEKFIIRNGMTYEATTKSGTLIQKRPEVQISNSALLAFKSFAAEFGLTPSSRSGINIKPAEDEVDPMEAILRKKGGG